MKRRERFSTAELISVFLLIVGLLIAIAVPLMEGSTTDAKWSGAIIYAGSIHKAVRDYAASNGVAAAQTLAGKNLSDRATQALLGFEADDLESTYFTASDYTITSVDGNGVAAITVTGSKADAPHGSYRLETDGNWVRR